VGLAQAALDEARIVLREQRMGFSAARWERITADFEAMEAALHGGRMLIRNAAQLLDRGMPFSREASSAKAYVPPLAERVIARILRILGPNGYSEELLFEKWHRDVKIIDIWEGTGRIQRRTISRALMGSNAAA
jgi:acyl-CoA dehydrogenase